MFLVENILVPNAAKENLSLIVRSLERDMSIKIKSWPSASCGWIDVAWIACSTVEQDTSIHSFTYTHFGRKFITKSILDASDKRCGSTVVVNNQSFLVRVKTGFVEHSLFSQCFNPFWFSSSERPAPKYIGAFRSFHVLVGAARSEQTDCDKTISEKYQSYIGQFQLSRHIAEPRVQAVLIALFGLLLMLLGLMIEKFSAVLVLGGGIIALASPFIVYLFWLT